MPGDDYNMAKAYLLKLDAHEVLDPEAANLNSDHSTFSHFQSAGRSTPSSVQNAHERSTEKHEPSRHLRYSFAGRDRNGKIVPYQISTRYLSGYAKSICGEGLDAQDDLAGAQNRLAAAMKDVDAASEALDRARRERTRIEEVARRNDLVKMIATTFNELPPDDGGEPDPNRPFVRKIRAAKKETKAFESFSEEHEGS